MIILEYVYIGKIVNTHGIKGEIRILSDFELKDQIFKKGFVLYIGDTYEKRYILTYRKHKMYDMVTLDGITSIDDALIYKGRDVYAKRDSLYIPTYLKEDLIGLSVYTNNKYIGTVSELRKNKVNTFLVVDGKHMIPLLPEFVLNVDLDHQKIIIKNMKGLLDED